MWHFPDPYKLQKFGDDTVLERNVLLKDLSVEKGA